MERVEQILEILADSPQIIVLITMSAIVLIASVINLLIGMHIMKLTKTLKIENKQNTEQIMQHFTERWDRADKLIKGQPQENEVPIPNKVTVPSLVLMLT